MNMLLWNVLLALTWGAMTGNFAPENLLVGLGLGFMVLAVAQGAQGRTEYARRALRVVRFVGFYLWELLLANFQVAYDVVTPTTYTRPGIVAVPLDARTDAEITLLANLLTMTPGTLSIDVSSDRRTLYVHSMYITDPDLVRTKIKDGFERRVLEILR